MFAFAIILICIMYIYIDLVPVIKQKEWKVFIVYSILTASTIVLSVLITLNVELPSLSKGIENVFNFFKEGF